jgi:hypothetical protein
MECNPSDPQDRNEAVIQRLQETIDAIKTGRWQLEEARGGHKLNATPGRHEYVLMVRLSCDNMAEHPAPEP